MHAVVARKGGRHRRDDGDGQRRHHRRRQVVEVHARGIRAVEVARLLERVAQRVLELALHKRRVDQRDDRHHRGRQRDGDGDGEQALQDRAGGIRRVCARGARAVAQVVDEHVDEREHRADRHADDGRGRGDVVLVPKAHDVHRKAKADEELADRLDDLRDGGRRHAKAALRKAAERGKAADAHNARGKRLDTVGGVRVIEKRRALLVAEPHDDKREDTER